MKKVLAIFLILIMTVFVAACDIGNQQGNEPSDPYDGYTLIDTLDDGTSIYMDADGNLFDQNLNPYNPEDDDFGEEINFDFDMNKTYKMDDILVERDVKDLSTLQETLLSVATTTLKNSFGSEFELDTGFNENGTDAIVGVYGYEEGDVDKKNIEMGVYRSGESIYDEYYITYSSECFLDSTEETITSVINSLKNAFGISLSKQALKDSAEQILSCNEDTIYDVYRYQTSEFDRELFTDRVSLCVSGYMLGSAPCWYIGVEVSRTYR